jgi:hypothetical protein
MQDFEEEGGIWGDCLLTELGHLVRRLLLIPAEHGRGGVVVDGERAGLHYREQELQVFGEVRHGDGVWFCECGKERSARG